MRRHLPRVGGTVRTVVTGVFIKYDYFTDKEDWYSVIKVLVVVFGGPVHPRKEPASAHDENRMGCRATAALAQR